MTSNARRLQGPARRVELAVADYIGGEDCLTGPFRRGRQPRLTERTPKPLLFCARKSPPARGRTLVRTLFWRAPPRGIRKEILELRNAVPITVDPMLIVIDLEADTPALL